MTALIKAAAQRLGFELVGIAPAVTPTGLHDFLDWLEQGYAGEMKYLERREEAYEHPRHVLDGVRSVIMLGMNYKTEELESAGAPREGVVPARGPLCPSADRLSRSHSRQVG